MTEIPSQQEIERQYSVASQTLAMHHMLKDRYRFRARFAEILLLIASVVFCASTFASGETYGFFEIDALQTKFVLGIASVAAFAGALVLAVFDWPGKASRHEDATRKWTLVLQEFRESRGPDAGWPEDRREELSRAYWSANENTLPIPDADFNTLKSAYLTKVEASRLISRNPGLPSMFACFAVRARGTIGLFHNKKEETERRKERGGGTDESETGE